jgi:hypothetical protein
MRFSMRGTCSGLTRLVAFLGVLAATSCAINPVSGEREFVMISEARRSKWGGRGPPR